MCQVHTGAYVSLLAPGNQLYIALATRERLPRIYHTQYLSLRIRTSDASQLEKRNIKEKTRKERKEEKNQRKRKGKKRKEKARKTRKEKRRKGGKERKREEKISC